MVQCGRHHGESGREFNIHLRAIRYGDECVSGTAEADVVECLQSQREEKLDDGT